MYMIKKTVSTAGENDNRFNLVGGHILKERKAIVVVATAGHRLSLMSKKLDNKNFINNAPEKVIEIERKKQSDAEAKIKALEIQLENL